MNNKLAYNRINERAIEYKEKVNRGILEEEYVLRENVLRLEEDIRLKYGSISEKEER